jgi:hypothetical protein
MDAANITPQRTRWRHSVELRCSVCRRRDWQQGGNGRGPKLGTISLRSGSLLVEQDPRRALGAAMDRAIPAGQNPGTEYGALEDAAEARWRCRRGHRLRFDAAGVLRELESGAEELWLPPA